MDGNVVAELADVLDGQDLVGVDVAFRLGGEAGGGVSRAFKVWEGELVLEELSIFGVPLILLNCTERTYCKESENE